MLAVLLFVTTNFSHIHIRYCFDGQESPVSIHIESEKSHSFDSFGEENVSDIENELYLNTLITKSFNDSVLHSPIHQSLSLIRKTTQKYSHSHESIIPETPASFLPPQRAPPLKA